MENREKLMKNREKSMEEGEEFDENRGKIDYFRRLSKSQYRLPNF